MSWVHQRGSTAGMAGEQRLACLELQCDRRWLNATHPDWGAGGSGHVSGSESAGAGRVHGRVSGCGAAGHGPCHAHDHGCATCTAENSMAAWQSHQTGCSRTAAHHRHGTTAGQTAALRPLRRADCQYDCGIIDFQPRNPCSDAHRRQARKHALVAHRLRRSRLLLRSLLLDLRSRLRLLLRRRDLPSRSLVPLSCGSAPRSSPPRRSSGSRTRSGGAPPSLIAACPCLVAEALPDAVLEVSGRSEGAHSPMKVQQRCKGLGRGACRKAVQRQSTARRQRAGRLLFLFC